MRPEGHPNKKYISTKNQEEGNRKILMVTKQKRNKDLRTKETVGISTGNLKTSRDSVKTTDTAQKTPKKTLRIVLGTFL